MAISPTTKYILEAFIPFSRANLKLSYKPSTFFYELEQKSKTNERTLRSAYYRAVKQGLLEIDDKGIPRLTAKGRVKAKVYKPKLLQEGAYLLVVFDIGEDERNKRSHLRMLLRELSFKKVQQSVWMSRYDHRDYLAMELKEYGIENNVIVYEAVHLPV